MANGSQNLEGVRNEFLEEAGYTTFRPGQGDIRIFLAGLIQVALSVVGVIFLIMVFYGGYLWLTAGGNEEQVTKSQGIIRYALIGFSITLGALIITRAIVFWLGTGVLGPLQQ
ncbi:hypothetical protein HY477_04045 [Candidatus Uhrbacteria bacterium]|nr:hypothetical protein [Candidatus Uhrbacteria bacterium]